MDLRSLEWRQGQVNPSGIRPIAYFIHKKDIIGFPTTEDDIDVARDINEYVNYTNDFVLAENAYWKTIYSSQGKGSATWEAIGEKDCKMFTNKGILSYPDVNDEGRALTKAVVNDNVVIIIPLPIKGRFIILGNEYYDVECTPTGTTGDAPGSAKGLTIEISVPDTTPLPCYKGILQLEDKKIDCATGNVLSSDATLKRIILSAGTLSPEFDKNTFEYNVNIGSSTTEISISAQPSSKRATIDGEVTDAPLASGENRFDLLVTAEDGTTKTYSLIIYK